ncbi:MAG: hypothetical protein ACREKE_03765, partial [bacterium]
MSAKRAQGRDPLEAEIEAALCPGTFIRSSEDVAFVADLEEVASKISELTKTDPTRCARLHDAFLAGCYAKYEEMGYSDDIPVFVVGLYCA